MIYFELGPGARPYVEERLASGNTLSRLLVRRLPPGWLRARVALPDGASLPQVDDLRFGGKFPTVLSREREDGSRVTKVETALPDLALEVVSYLGRHQKAFLLLENRLAAPTDPWLKRLTIPTVFFDLEVYHLLTGQTSPAAAEEALRAAFRPSGFAGVLGKGPADREPRSPHEKNLTPANLEAFAEAAEILIVDAFDGESFLLVELSSGLWSTAGLSGQGGAPGGGGGGI